MPTTHGKISANAVALSEDDWREIYQALVCQGSAIAAGAYDPDEYGDLDEWKKELQEILERIGPDGSIAAEVGVKPVPGAQRIA
jgi:hypothetical protein